MRLIIKKTEKERESETNEKEITVVSRGYFYVACDTCNMAFFTNDIILFDSNGYFRCPNKIKGGFIKKNSICKNKMYGGDEESFNRYYKLKQIVMLQEIKTLRDFLKNPDEQLKFLPLQIESCLLFKDYVKGEDGVSRLVLHVFDSTTAYIGTIENPHYIPKR